MLDKSKYNEKKMTAYDEFKCIADKCKITCCSGWDINVDNGTYNRWKSEPQKCEDIIDELLFKKDGNIIINKKTNEACPLLDSQGLCNIVKEHGEQYLCLTCKKFPRIDNTFEGIREFTLSCACPEVVDIIEKSSGLVSLEGYTKENKNQLPIEIKIRDTIVNIIQCNYLSLEERLLLSYEMMLNILACDELTEESVLEEINKYNNSNLIVKLKGNEQIHINFNKSVKAINNFFLDIIENYKRVPIFMETLSEISQLSMKIYRGQIKVNELLEKWNVFNKCLHEYNFLVENCIIVKIFGNCISEDIEEVTLSLELIIIEYILVKYSMFLKMLLNENIEMLESIKEYIVIFSRIIGNNSDAVIDFIEDEFGDIFIEYQYLKLLSI